MKKIVVFMLVLAAGLFYSNNAVASVSSVDNVYVSVDSPGDPSQRMIDKINSLTTLTGDQVVQIQTISSGLDWDAPGIRC